MTLIGNDEAITQEQEQEQQQEQETQEARDDTPTDDAIIAALSNPSDKVKAAIDALIEAGIKKALAGTTPKRQTVKSDPLTPEQFTKLTYKERVQLYNTNRPLYEKLKG